jgi:dTDP-4-dehydrorhamnose 3,5-epimerase
VNQDVATSFKLEKHDTRDINGNHVNGSLTVVWRDWDSVLKNDPKMVYVSSVNAGETKGPHLHTKRNSYFICIHGKVVFVIKQKDGKYLEIESSAEEPKMVYVPKNCPSAHLNISNDISRVLAIADLAWRPNDDEMKNVEFDDYDWSKWKTNTDLIR